MNPPRGIGDGNPFEGVIWEFEDELQRFRSVHLNAFPPKPLAPFLGVRLDKALDELRTDELRQRSLIGSHCATYARNLGWPAKFLSFPIRDTTLLQERLTEAVSFLKTCKATHVPDEIPDPLDEAGVRNWVLIEHWNTEGVENWLARERIRLQSV